MIVIHDPLGLGTQRLTETKWRLECCEGRKVGRAAGLYPAQKTKAAEVNVLHGRIAVLEELIDGLEAG